MTENWAYLVGSEDELSPVWESYYVVAAVDEEARVADVPEEWKVDRVRGVDALRRDIASRYTVTHQARSISSTSRGVCAFSTLCRSTRRMWWLISVRCWERTGRGRFTKQRATVSQRFLIPDLPGFRPTPE